MTTRATRPTLATEVVPGRAPNTVRRVLARRGSGQAEVVAAVGVYGVYEASRGLLAGDARTAIRHATDIATLERSIHLSTGNHFLLDAVAGALVVGVAALSVRALVPAVATPELGPE